jgi:hypothetical protein
MGPSSPPRMRSSSASSSSSCRIKLVLRCNVLHCSVHVLKPAVFIAPLRLGLNHTPTALLLAMGLWKGGSSGEFVGSRGKVATTTNLGWGEGKLE